MRLGLMYRDGRGVPADAERAATLLSRAAAQGVVPPAAVLPPPAPSAAVEVEEVHVPVQQEQEEDARVAPTDAAPDPDLAPVLPDPLEHAESGDAETSYALAERYSRGTGLPQDPAQAERWYLEAARAGNVMARYRLAFLYLRGRVDGRKDFVRAHAWLTLAAEDDLGDARAWLPRLEKKMSDEELEEAASLVARLRGGSTGN
jgi:TPR repeat protein